MLDYDSESDRPCLDRSFAPSHGNDGSMLKTKLTELEYENAKLQTDLLNRYMCTCTCITN